MTDWRHTTTSKREVNIPEWAEELEVGDQIKWDHSEAEEGPHVAEVVGFSTKYDMGFPVIPAPAEPFGRDPESIPEGTTVAISESAHLIGKVEPDA